MSQQPTENATLDGLEAARLLYGGLEHNKPSIPYERPCIERPVIERPVIERPTVPRPQQSIRKPTT